jgi:hypothetical protein
MDSEEVVDEDAGGEVIQTGHAALRKCYLVVTCNHKSACLCGGDLRLFTLLPLNFPFRECFVGDYSLRPSIKPPVPL